MIYHNYISIIICIKINNIYLCDTELVLLPKLLYYILRCLMLIFDIYSITDLR